MSIKKNLVFRADGNANTGLGHLYRLFALVEMLKEDYNFVFITKASSTLEIIPENYNLYTIPDNISLLEEAKWLSKRFNPISNALISDGYQFDSVYQKKINEEGFKHLYVDDLEAYSMYADVVVNHSSASKKEHFKVNGKVDFGLGTDYALLRPLFLKEAKINKTEAKVINEVFVCFGGADKFNLAELTVKALLKINQIEKIHVIVGAASKNKKVNTLKLKQKSKIEIYRNLSEKNLLTIMKKCNLAIVPTSTIFYEIACVKIPTISGFFVDNQIGVYNWFKSQNCFYGVDNFVTFNFETLEKVIEIVKKNTVNYMKNQSLSIDGNQKERFLKLINYLN